MNKIQTNKQGINILVQTDNSNNQHSHYKNKIVKNINKLTNKNLDKLIKERLTKVQIRKACIKLLIKTDNIAISNVKDDILNIDHNDIISFEYK